MHLQKRLRQDIRCMQIVSGLQYVLNTIIERASAHRGSRASERLRPFPGKFDFFHAPNPSTLACMPSPRRAEAVGARRTPFTVAMGPKTMARNVEARMRRLGAPAAGRCGWICCDHLRRSPSPLRSP